MLNQISMIMLGVGDIAVSVEFYRDRLGLKLQNQSAEFAFFTAGPVTLALGTPLGKAVTPRAGAVEIIFPVDSVNAAYSELTHRGCKFLNEPRVVNGPNYAATLTDPDGHKLTLFGGK